MKYLLNFIYLNNKEKKLKNKINKLKWIQLINI